MTVRVSRVRGSLARFDARKPHSRRRSPRHRMSMTGDRRGELDAQPCLSKGSPASTKQGSLPDLPAIDSLTRVAGGHPRPEGSGRTAVSRPGPDEAVRRGRQFEPIRPRRRPAGAGGVRAPGPRRVRARERPALDCRPGRHLARHRQGHAAVGRSARPTAGQTGPLRARRPGRGRPRLLRPVCRHPEASGRRRHGPPAAHPGSRLATVSTRCAPPGPRPTSSSAVVGRGAGR